jgi:hypothetical protein
MVCGTFRREKLSETEADIAVVGYQSNDPPPVSVTKTKENGTWTVTAVFSPCPPNTTHSVG